MFDQLFNSPFLYSLSLTLVHFLWQGLLVALILKSLLFIVDKNKSKLRYTLATLAMLANAILAVLTYAMVYPDTGSGINSNLSPIPLTSLVNELTQQNALFTYQELLPSILAYALPYLSLFWLATITILASKLLIEIRNVNNLPRHSSVSPSLALSSRFDELAKQIKLTKTPKLLISLKAEVPMAIGWLKPVVLLPATMVTGLNSSQLEMLILHELAHIRRHDYLVNFLQTLIELLFFFHPSVHWIGKQMRNEREYCSDDIAVQHCGDAIAYAHTLTDTASLCSKNHFHTIPTMAMAASGGDLKARVLRLVDHHCAPTNNTSKLLAAMTLFLTLILLSINQLLTMPFTQQLNDQFPWQEPPALSHNLFSTNVTAMALEKTNTNRQGTTLKNDSIAQQLLSRQNTPSHGLLVAKNNEQRVRNLTTENDIGFTTATFEPVTISNQRGFIETVEELDPSKQLASNNIKEPKTKAEDTKEQSKSKTVVLFAPTVLDTFKIEDNFPSTVNEQIAVAVQPQVQIILPSIPTEMFVQDTTQLNPDQEESKQVSLTYDKDLTIKDNAYRQLIYNQEIKELAVQNKLYQTSHSVIDAKSQRLEASQITQTKQIPSSLEAKLLNSISPIYPNLAKRRGIEMEVKVDFTIDKNGKVKDINFDQQSKLIYFKSAIRSAIRKWRFSPAKKNNRKIESKMTKIFSFSLHA
ncbi:M56 family metallopeptidase [Colwellia sp. 12G3]|uniref:M56 family metallopeptidase n=1 Tax=Colwellia sp. 12G3 TaxID=2058299 RepID=UPI000C322392|nr:M56 family metallopeptidase [Colwellia sp. 12G3]PKI13005.1 peptidase M56 [Colwellia sp. 12G3]